MIKKTRIAVASKVAGFSAVLSNNIFEPIEGKSHQPLNFHYSQPFISPKPFSLMEENPTVHLDFFLTENKPTINDYSVFFRKISIRNCVYTSPKPITSRKIVNLAHRKKPYRHAGIPLGLIEIKRKYIGLKGKTLLVGWFVSDGQQSSKLIQPVINKMKYRIAKEKRSIEQKIRQLQKEAGSLANKQLGRCIKTGSEVNFKSNEIQKGLNRRIRRLESLLVQNQNQCNIIRWQRAIVGKVDIILKPTKMLLNRLRFPIGPIVRCTFNIPNRKGSKTIEFFLTIPSINWKSITPKKIPVATVCISFEQPSDDSICLLTLCISITDNLFNALIPQGTRGKVFQSKSKFPDNFTINQSDRCFHRILNRQNDSCGINRENEKVVLGSNVDAFDLVFPMLEPPLKLDDQKDLLLPAMPYPYQLDGIDFLTSRYSALLSDEMGTGKTVMATIALRLLTKKGRILCSIIICPSSVLGVWEEHIRKWSSDLKYIVIKGIQQKRKIAWRHRVHVYIVTYDTLRSDIEATNLPEEISFDLMICDEAQYVKNYNSKRTKSVKEVSKRCHYRWALTGTPLENNISELMTIFKIIYPKCANILRFDGTQYHKESQSHPLSPKEAKKIIKPFFLRRRKKEVLKELPPKIRQLVWLDMDPKQRKDYEAIKNQEIAKLRFLQDEGKMTKLHVLSVIQKMKQICNFAHESYNSPKLRAVCSLLEDIAANHKKALIFTQYLNAGLIKLAYGLEKRGFSIVTLSGKLSERIRQKRILEFRTDPNKVAFICTVKAGGTGITLAEASYVIHFDHWWNPAIMWQAEDRVHRIGQTEPVNIYSLWMRDSIDERIYNILSEKQILFEQIVDDLSVGSIESQLSLETLMYMVGLKSTQFKIYP